MCTQRPTCAPPTVQPHSPSRAWVGKGGHTAQKGPGVWDGAWQQMPSSQAWTTSIKLGGGRGKGLCPGPAGCPPPWSLLRPPPRHGVTVLSSFPRGGSGALASQPRQLPRGGQGQDSRWGPLGCLKQTPPSTTVAVRVCWPRLGGDSGHRTRQPAPQGGQSPGWGAEGHRSTQLGRTVGSGPRRLCWRLVVLRLSQTPPWLYWDSY